MSILRSVAPVLGSMARMFHRTVHTCSLRPSPRFSTVQHSHLGGTGISNCPTRSISSVLHGLPLLRALSPLAQIANSFKTKSSVKRRCKDCYFVRRKGRLFVLCKAHPRHKQRQG